MAFRYEIEGPEHFGRKAVGRHERRPVTRSTHLAVGTLACPRCDAPVLPQPGQLSPADPLGCGFCEHSGAVRDFLTLGPPTRPTRVEVRVVERARAHSIR
jgi:hypothetical protein